MIVRSVAESDLDGMTAVIRTAFGGEEAVGKGEKNFRMSSIRKKAAAGLQIGDAFTVTRTFTEADTTAFADISRDYNPVHFDDRFAAAKQFRGRICHGLLVASILTEIGGQIGWLASGMRFRFRKPVYFGDTVECRFTLTELDDRHRAEAEAVFTNQREEVVLEASLSGIIPGPAEKEVLGRMMAEGDPTNPRGQTDSP